MTCEKKRDYKESETRYVTSLQSSQPTEWIMKARVHIRIATKILETIEEAMHTTVMVCCCVEASLWMTIVKAGTACAKAV